MLLDVSFVSEVTDIPAFKALLLDYYGVILKVFAAAGGPRVAPRDMVDKAISHLGEMLPPKGRLALVRSQDGRLMGCGALRRIRTDAVEMKQMFVRPEVQGQGLGRKLFKMRIAEARHMGCRSIYADTVRGTARCSRCMRNSVSIHPALSENPNPAELEPYFVYLEYRIPDEQPVDPSCRGPRERPRQVR